ncbi:MAG: hypothetical protein U0361_14430 [Nitrospiraceae bacterium]
MFSTADDASNERLREQFPQRERFDARLRRYRDRLRAEGAEQERRERDRGRNPLYCATTSPQAVIEESTRRTGRDRSPATVAAGPVHRAARHDVGRGAAQLGQTHRGELFVVMEDCRPSSLGILFPAADARMDVRTFIDDPRVRATIDALRRDAGDRASTSSTIQAGNTSTWSWKAAVCWASRWSATPTRWNVSASGFLGIGGTSAGSINALLMAALDRLDQPKSHRILDWLAEIDLFAFVDGDGDARRMVEAIVEKAGTPTLVFRGAQVR